MSDTTTLVDALTTLFGDKGLTADETTHLDNHTVIKDPEGCAVCRWEKENAERPVP